MLSYPLPRRSSRALGSLFTAAFLAVAAAAHTTDAMIAPSQTTISAIGRSKLVGKPSPTQTLHILVGVKLGDPEGLKKFVADVNNPKSLNYRHFLSAAAVGDRFGQSQSTINTIVSYLRGKGMTAVATADRTAVEVTGSVKQAESAFGTTLANYQAPASEPMVGGKIFFANQSPIKVPTSIASKINVVAGLENYYRPKKLTSHLTPTQTRTLYAALPLYQDLMNRGEGVRIGISNFDGFRLSNLQLLYSLPVFNLPSPAAGIGTNVEVLHIDGGTGDTDPQTDYASEGDLDIQLALAMAPLANLIVYDAANGFQGYLDTLAREASPASGDPKQADIISESYGWATIPGAGGTAPYLIQANASHTVMMAEGITYLAASGDDGTYGALTTAPPYSFVYPDIDPNVLIVGGTVATIDGNGNRLVEDGWNGSGGGWIANVADFPFNVRSSWQMNISVPNDAKHNYRLFPDVALHAAGSNTQGTSTSDDYYTAYDYVYKGALNAVSGTSAASPTFAGQLALVLEQLRNDGYFADTPDSPQRLGQINEALYQFDADSSVNAFTDIITGPSNGVLPDGSTSSATVGWDFVTGLGAPIIANLYGAYSLNASVATTDLANSATPYQFTSTQTLGTAPIGSASDLTSTDGSTYSVQSVTQNGVGQVAAATVGFTLQGDATKRRSLTMSAAVSAPSLTVAYVYVKNVQTGSYDLESTLIGDGTMKSVNFTFSNATDLAKYIDGSNNVSVLVRATKPARLGAAPFRLSIDKLTSVERIAKS